MHTLRPDSLVRQVVATPIGDLVLVVRRDRLCMAEFADCGHRADRWLRMRQVKAGGDLRDGEIPASIAQAFAAYFGGEFAALGGIGVELSGTDFQNAVWSALRRIPPGTTLGYGAMAGLLGRAQAARAVGHANGANPLSIVVPCHRLVGAGGALVKYGGGLWRKRWLIEHEAGHAVQS